MLYFDRVALSLDLVSKAAKRKVTLDFPSALNFTLEPTIPTEIVCSRPAYELLFETIAKEDCEFAVQLEFFKTVPLSVSVNQRNANAHIENGVASFKLSTQRSQQSLRIAVQVACMDPDGTVAKAVIGFDGEKYGKLIPLANTLPVEIAERVRYFCGSISRVLTIKPSHDVFFVQYSLGNLDEVRAIGMPSSPTSPLSLVIDDSRSAIRLHLLNGPTVLYETGARPSRLMALSLHPTDTLQLGNPCVFRLESTCEGPPALLGDCCICPSDDWLIVGKSVCKLASLDKKVILVPLRSGAVMLPFLRVTGLDDTIFDCSSNGSSVDVRPPQSACSWHSYPMAPR